MEPPKSVSQNIKSLNAGVINTERKENVFDRQEAFFIPDMLISRINKGRDRTFIVMKK